MHFYLSINVLYILEYGGDAGGKKPDQTPQQQQAQNRPQQQQGGSQQPGESSMVIQHNNLYTMHLSIYLHRVRVHTYIAITCIHVNAYGRIIKYIHIIFPYVNILV